MGRWDRNQKSGPVKAEQVVREIRRATRRQFSAEEKIHIFLSGLRGEDNIPELCRCEGIVQNPLLSLVEGISRSVWPAMRRERQPRTRSRSCAGRPVRSRRWWLSCRSRTGC